MFLRFLARAFLRSVPFFGMVSERGDGARRRSIDDGSRRRDGLAAATLRVAADSWVARRLLVRRAVRLSLTCQASTAL